ncbi:hypothetical protein Tco_1156624 [Tanacetum coccineum]
MLPIPYEGQRGPVDIYSRPRWQLQKALLLATKWWRGSKGYDDGFGNQGTRLKTGDAPKDLEVSPPHCK